MATVQVKQDQLKPIATGCPDTTKHSLTIYTQNVHGLRANEDKIEYISRLMELKHINVYMLHETHLDGDFIFVLPKGQLMIQHGPKMQPHQHVKGGIAIILSWDNGLKISRSGLMDRLSCALSSYWIELQSQITLFIITSLLAHMLNINELNLVSLCTHALGKMMLGCQTIQPEGGWSRPASHLLFKHISGWEKVIRIPTRARGNWL